LADLRLDLLQRFPRLRVERGTDRRWRGPRRSGGDWRRHGGRQSCGWGHGRRDGWGAARPTGSEMHAQHGEEPKDGKDTDRGAGKAGHHGSNSIIRSGCGPGSAASRGVMTGGLGSAPLLDKEGESCSWKASDREARGFGRELCLIPYGNTRGGTGLPPQNTEPQAGRSLRGFQPYPRCGTHTRRPSSP